MGERIKRGIMHPGSKVEAQIVGPYPPWDAWKHNLFNEFPSLDHSIPTTVKEAFGDYYIIRRLEQKGIDQAEELKKWCEEVGKKIPNFFELYIVQLTFIRDHTGTELAMKERYTKATKAIPRFQDKY